MRTNIRRDPKVVAMARFLSSQRAFMLWWGDPVRITPKENVTEIVTFQNVTRVTVCALLEVWGSLNGTIKGESTIPFMAVEDLDDIAEVPCLGRAMLEVGWVVETPEGLTFPNFMEFNTPDSARKAPKSNAQRQREWRERQRMKSAVTEVTESNARVEERRVDIFNPQNPLFEKFLKVYPRSGNRDKALEQFERLNPVEAEAVVEAATHYAFCYSLAEPEAKRYAKGPVNYLRDRVWAETKESIEAALGVADEVAYRREEENARRRSEYQRSQWAKEKAALDAERARKESGNTIER